MKAECRGIEMSFIITRNDGFPMYFTAGASRDFANIGGAWVPEIEKSLQFARSKDARDFLNSFKPHDEPHCTVIMYEPRIDITV